MRSVPKTLVLILMMGLTFCGCGGKGESANQQVVANVQPGETLTSDTPATVPATAVEVPAGTPAASGFDIGRAPVVNPQLGKFPYVSLIEGYQRSKHSSTPMGSNKDVDFRPVRVF